MRKSRFTEEQIALALRQAEGGTPVAEVCRKLGITETTFYRCKKRFGSLGVPELRELRQLREENRRLTGLGGGSHAGPFHPPGGAAKKMVRPDAWRALVRWAQVGYRVSERRACRAVGISRSVVR